VSLSIKILISLALGILVGVFFGEEVAFLDIIGEIFIRLLQMSVLPYITVSLIHSIGSLSFRAAGLLIKTAGVFLLLLWGIVFFIVLLMPLSFPSWESASYFSTTIIAGQSNTNVLDLYIPANPFNSLAFSVIPAVVLFSIALGVALIKVEGKERLLQILATLERALASITLFIVEQAPYGVFAITAAAAGTMELNDIAKMNVFTVAYISMSLLTALWVLPALVAAITPLSYKELMGPTRDALITAFAIGNVFAVLPVLLAQTKKVLDKVSKQNEEAINEIEIIIPTAYNFPKAGNILALGFVLFAGWYTGFDPA